MTLHNNMVALCELNRQLQRSLDAARRKNQRLERELDECKRRAKAPRQMELSEVG